MKTPSSNGRKFYISSPKATTPATPNVPTPITGSDRSRDRLRKLMRDIIVGEAAPRPEEQIVTSLSECLQLSFHRCLRHIICLVYAREVLLVDLRIQHTVIIFFIELLDNLFHLKSQIAAINSDKIRFERF